MGDCYSANISVKFKRNGKRNATKALHEYIKRQNENGVCFHLDEYADRGISHNTFDGLVRIFFADWNGNQFLNGEYRKGKDGKVRLYKRDKNGFRVYNSDFNASYGWGCILWDFASIIAPYLADGSTISVYADETDIFMEIIDGEAVFTNDEK